MAPPTEFPVGADEDGDRLDRIASRRFPETSRSEVARWAQDGRIELDGRPRRPGTACRAGQQVRVAPPEAPAGPGLDPEPVPLAVLHEDEHLAVLDKPPGLVTHPGPGHPTGTLAHGVAARYPETAGVGAPDRPGIVHRLDRGTSGVLVVARTEPARLRLAEAFAARTVDKRYLALVLGRFPEPRRLAEPIGRDPRHPQRYRVRGRSAKDAETEARPLEELPLSAWLELRLHTGRTHQARVHLAGAGRPLAGDALYGPAAPKRGGGRAGAALRRLTRPALHAASITFPHPATGEAVRFEAPLSEDLARVLADLREAAREGDPARDPPPGRPRLA